MPPSANAKMRKGEIWGVNQEVNQATEQSIDKFLVGGVRWLGIEIWNTSRSQQHHPSALATLCLLWPPPVVHLLATCSVNAPVTPQPNEAAALAF